MERGVVSESVRAQVRDSGTQRLAGFVSRQMILGAVVAVIALVYHITGSSGSTANMSVLALGVLIAQVTVPHRQLRSLLYPQPPLRTIVSPSPERGALAMQLTSE